MQNVTSPYVATVINLSVLLKPEQMNENIYNNLKDNIITTYKDRCYKDFGVIVDIIKILEKSDGICDINNIKSYASFNVKTSVILCKPVESNYIYCQIEDIAGILILAKNGPITIIITPDKINGNRFIMQGSNLRYKDEKNKKVINVVKGDIIKIKIIKCDFKDKSDNITIMAFLDDITTDDEIKIFYDDYYKSTNYLKAK